LSQVNNIALKVILHAGLKFGSQTPAVGEQFFLIDGVIFNEKKFAGIGRGYYTIID